MVQLYLVFKNTGKFQAFMKTFGDSPLIKLTIFRMGKEMNAQFVQFEHGFKSL